MLSSLIIFNFRLGVKTSNIYIEHSSITHEETPSYNESLLIRDSLTYIHTDLKDSTLIWAFLKATVLFKWVIILLSAGQIFSFSLLYLPEPKFAIYYYCIIVYRTNY